MSDGGQKITVSWEYGVDRALLVRSTIAVELTAQLTGRNTNLARMPP
jgi:hypothetical protein